MNFNKEYDKWNPVIEETKTYWIQKNIFPGYTKYTLYWKKYSKSQVENWNHKQFSTKEELKKFMKKEKIK